MAVSLKRNIVANGLGTGWRTLMSIAAVPLYIKYLGIEVYGLIGIFTLLQVWLTLLDMGMKPALGREMARFTAGAHNAQSIRDLLRSVERTGITIAVIIVLGIWAASRWLASDWLRAESLPIDVVARALTLMGFVIAMRFVEDIYTSSLAGLQRQVEQNVVTSIMATVQAGGAVAILAWVSCTITAFFLWQGLISLITVVLFSGVVYHALPAATRPARASWTALRGIWQFAAGMMALTCLSLFLTQVDKILLTRLLSLRNFGYYTLAGVIASGLNALTGAIAAAFYPRFTALATAREHAAFRAAYHQGAQLVTVLTGAAAVVLMVFGDRVMLLWTADPALAQRVAPLLTVMALGTLLSGLMWIPSQMMLAHGWTTLAIKANTIVVCVLVPAILWVVPRYGAIGAAWVWVLLNTFYLIFTISLMHRRLLPAEKWLWYREDVVTPLVAATGVALLCRWLVPNQLSRLGELSALFISSVCVLLGSALAAPAVRDQLTKHLSRTLKPIAATTE